MISPKGNIRVRPTQHSPIRRKHRLDQRPSETGARQCRQFARTDRIYKTPHGIDLWRSIRRKRCRWRIPRPEHNLKKLIVPLRLEINSPSYGAESQNWFFGIHCFTKYVKVARDACSGPNVHQAGQPGLSVRGDFCRRVGQATGLTSSIPSMVRCEPMSSVYRRVTPAARQAPRIMLSQCDRLNRSDRSIAESNTSGVGSTRGNRWRNALTCCENSAGVRRP